MNIGFSTYAGADFLVFYCGLIVAAAIAAWWLPAFMRPDGRDGSPRRAETLAYLAGGKSRFTQAVVAALFARGDLQIQGRDIVRTLRATGESDSESSLLGQIGSFSWRETKPTLADHAERLDRELSARGLLIEPAARRIFRLLPVMPYACLVILGVVRLAGGAAAGEDVVLLALLTVLVAVLGIFRFVKFNPRTRAGDAALAEAQKGASRLQRAPRGNEVGFAVALFGTGVLVGTPFQPLHILRKEQHSDKSAGGCGAGSYSGGGYSHDSGDGGGDGGGGCGGCGGGGCGGCGG